MFVILWILKYKIMDKVQDALDGLVKKYDIAFNRSIHMYPGWKFLNKKLAPDDIPLFCWRSNRKFVELYKITSGNVVEHVCMLRFCCLTDKSIDLSTLIYRECDLCEFIGQGKITSLHATLTDDEGGNIIVKLDNGIICSVEIGNQLPWGSKMIDRHEIIARRGVASDLVVDTQIPQQSIYTYTEKGVTGYKDVDNELFGLDDMEIEFVRSAFDFIKNPHYKADYLLQHTHLSQLVNSAFASNKECRKIEIE